MLRRYLEQHHIDLDSGRSCVTLEREYWQVLEVLANEDGRDLARFHLHAVPSSKVRWYAFGELRAAVNCEASF